MIGSAPAADLNLKHFLHTIPYRLLQGRRLLKRIEDHPVPRVAPGQSEVSLSNPLVKCERLLLESIGTPVALPLQPYAWRKVQ